MKFELKTENDNYLKSFSHFLKIIFSLLLGIISKNYQIEYSCRILTIEKSKTHLKKLSKLFKTKSKQRIREFCRDFIN